MECRRVIANSPSFDTFRSAVPVGIRKRMLRPLPVLFCFRRKGPPIILETKMPAETTPVTLGFWAD